MAIECQDLGYSGGILASTEDGLVTGTNWQCSDQLVDGWTLPGFVPPPDTFAPPDLLGKNGVNPWGVRFISKSVIQSVKHLNLRPGILEDAEWIWPQGKSTWAACRILIPGYKRTSDDQLKYLYRCIATNKPDVKQMEIFMTKE